MSKRQGDALLLSLSSDPKRRMINNDMMMMTTSAFTNTTTTTTTQPTLLVNPLQDPDAYDAAVDQLLEDLPHATSLTLNITLENLCGGNYFWFEVEYTTTTTQHVISHPQDINEDESEDDEDATMTMNTTTTTTIIITRSIQFDLDHNFMEHNAASLVTLIAQAAKVLVDLKLVLCDLADIHQVTTGNPSQPRRLTVTSILEAFATAGHWKEQLKTLTLDCCNFRHQGAGMGSLSSYPLQLVSLVVKEGVMGDCRHVRSFLVKLPQLKDFQVMDARPKGFNVVDMLQDVHESEASSNLETLVLDTGHFQDSTDQDVVNFVNVLKGLPHLHTLEICSCEKHPMTPSVTAKILQALPETSIVVLKCPDIETLDRECIQHLANYLADPTCKLQVLTINWDKTIPPSVASDGYDAILNAVAQSLAVPASSLKYNIFALKFLIYYHLFPFNKFRPLFGNQELPIALWPYLLHRADTNDGHVDGYGATLLFSVLRERPDVINR